MKPKHYKVTRRRQIRGTTYTMVFTWSEGDPHIMIAFKGRIPHETIGVFDHEHERATITGRDAFIKEVTEYVKTTHPDTIADHYTYSSEKDWDKL